MLVLALCGVVADPGPVSASTLNVQITDTNDDACEGDTLSRLLTNTYVYVQRASAGTSSHISSGFRFPNITIAKGATILSATVSVYFPIGTYDDMYCTVHGHAADNAPNFSTEPNIISTASRPRTTANTGVISQPNWGTGWHNITVTTIVQEIVNRSGWASGNALALLMIAEIGGYSSAYIYDYSGDTSLAAKISITYANPGEMQPLIAYTDTAAVDTLRYSTYSTSWSAEATGPDTNDNNLTWHVAKTAPVGREHVVLAASYTNKTLYAFLYNGSTWSTKNLGTINTTDYRCFNAAYEHASGDLVIAAATTTANQIKYWVWNGTSWVVDGSTYTFTTIDRVINWARMASQRGTNQVSLVVMDNDSDVVGLIWDGNVNTWGNEKKLGTATASDPEAIAVEYMQASTYAGQALFVWGQSTTLYSWTWTGTAWEGVAAKSKAGLSGNIRWISLAADPSSDDMVVALWNEANDLQTVNWTGSAWGNIQSPEATSLYGSYFDHKPFDVIFESSGSHAVLVYTDNNGLMYRHTSNITAAWDAETYLDSTYASAIDSYWVELGRADGRHHPSRLPETDTAQRLLAYTWNGSSWSALTSIETTLYTGPTNNAYKSFALSVQPANASVVLSQAHYRWRNDDGAEAASVQRVGCCRRCPEGLRHRTA